jgi:hypothetical protein
VILFPLVPGARPAPGGRTAYSVMVELEDFVVVVVESTGGA